MSDKKPKRREFLFTATYAIGAVGAGGMGGYRLYDKRHRYTPAIITILSLIIISFIVINFKLNINDKYIKLAIKIQKEKFLAQKLTVLWPFEI